MLRAERRKLVKRSANLKPVTSSVPITENLTIGLDLGDKWAQLCALDCNGDVIETGRVKMSRDALSNRFGGIDPTRIAATVMSQPMQFIQPRIGAIQQRSERFPHDCRLSTGEHTQHLPPCQVQAVDAVRDASLLFEQ